MVKTATDTPFGGIFKQKYPEVFQFSVKNSLKNATTFAKKRADFERILNQKLNKKRFKNAQKNNRIFNRIFNCILNGILNGNDTPRGGTQPPVGNKIKQYKYVTET